MKKHLRFILAALCALVGMNSWAQADYSTNYPGVTLSRKDRAVTAIKLTTGTGTQTINNCQSSTVNPPLFIDKTSEEFTCAPGETLKATVTSGASWTHLYIYVDEAADGFGYEADETNHCALAGSDLKAWTHYKFGLSEGGWNSLGTSTGGGVALSEIPSFTAPTEPGVYRMRYKTDWNNIDPKGDLGDGTGAASGSNNIVKNGGAIIDVMLHVLSPLQGAYNNLLAQAQTDIDFAKSTESREMWNALVTNPANIYSPKTQPGEGSIAALLDGNISTYWHSRWENPVGDYEEHYLQFDLGQAYSDLQMQYQRRQGVANDHPTVFSIKGSNDGENFEEIKTIEVTGDGDAVRHTWNIENSTAYRYIRVRATNTDNWRGYWHASEMNFYHYEFYNGADLYTKAGEIATQIEAILANPSAAPTQEDVDALQALCDALHALIHDIDQYRGYPGKLNMYSGYKATEEQVAALAEAIENYDAAAAKAVVDALEAVDNARTAFTLVTERAPLFAAEHEGAYLLVGGNNKFDLALEEGSDLGKWAFVDFDGGKYLYNVGAKLFANDNLTMTATPTANAISVVESGDATYPFMVKSGANYFNVSNSSGGYNEGLVIDSWSAKDGGNQFKIAVAADFDPAVAVEILISAPAEADMERLQALWTDLTQFIDGKEEYITADVRQAIETIMGDSWATAINGAYEDAMENSTAYVSPDIWGTLDTQISWVKDQINAVINGEVALYTENGVVGDGTLQSKGMPFFNTEAEVEVYTNHITIKAWDGVEGSDLTVAFAGMQAGDEVRTAIIGIEQTVDGEVVSELIYDDAEEGEEEDGAVIGVTLRPAAGYSEVAIDLQNEMTGIMIGQEEAGMGALSLFGTWLPESEEGNVDAGFGGGVEAAYMFQWPGQALVIPAEKLYEANGEIVDMDDEETWGASLFEPKRNIKVEVYDNKTAIIRGWAGTEGYDLKVAYDSKTSTYTDDEGNEEEYLEEYVSAVTPIVNGVEGETYTNGWAYIQMNDSETFLAYLASGFTFAAEEDGEGYVMLYGYDADENSGYYYIEWPQTPVVGDVVVNPDPEDEAPLYALDEVTLLFRDWTNAMGGGNSVATLKDAEDNEVATADILLEDEDVANLLTVKFDEPFATPGTYTLEVPVTLYSELTSESLNTTLSYTYTIVAAPVVGNYTVDPAEGEVDSLTTVKVTFADWTTVYGMGATLLSGEEEVSAAQFSEESEGNVAIWEFEEAFTTPGEYTLQLPVYLQNEDGTVLNTTVTLNYTIAEPVEPGFEPVVIDADNVNLLKHGSVIALMYAQIGFAGKSWFHADQLPIVQDEAEVIPEEEGRFQLENASEGHFYMRDMKTNKYVSRSQGKSAAGDQCDIVMVEEKTDGCEFQIVPTVASNANVYKGETNKTVQLLAIAKDSWTDATNYNCIKLGGNTGVPANWGLGGNGPWKLWRCYFLGDEEVPGDEDAIRGVDAAANGAAIYNINGQRVMKAQSGLYIINGKKVVVK